MKLKEILDKQLSIINYSSEEIKHFHEISNDLIEQLKKQKISAKIGGSLAKNTIIKSKKKPDIDIFVIFKEEKEIQNLGKILKKVKIDGKLKEIHGSRDYFQIHHKDVVLELIPVIETKDPALAKNVTDVSLSHVKYISKKLKSNPKLADEIKLAKSFVKAQNCYGAEGYIQGFSGYSIELLVIHFGSFVNFLKNFHKKRVIDPEKQFPNHKFVMIELNTSKLQSPIILIDPTYKYRNASAGLESETFEKLTRISKEFLKNPSLKYFEKKEFSEEEFLRNKSKDTRFIKLDLKTTRQSGDIAGTKMKKFFRHLASELQRKDQEILKKEFVYSGEGNTSEGYLILNERKQIIIRGPPVKMKEQARKFKESHKKVYKKKKYLYTTEEVSIENIIKSSKKSQKEMDVSLENYKIE